MQTDKVALVTGGSRGIGRAVAERLGATGMSVVVNYRSDREAAEDVTARIQDLGGKAVAVHADVTEPASLRGLFDAADEHFGGLDMLVNNVGITRFSAFVDTPDDDYNLLFDTNTRATFTALREAARRLRDSGRIVVMSSIVTAVSPSDTGVYGATRAAVDHFVRVLAKELGPRGITVNSVAPGPVNTEAMAAARFTPGVQDVAAQIPPLGRMAEPADIADIVAFLAGDDSRWISGQTIYANGGAF
ncbi:SDR family oxidoreductase [Streptomyces sp. NPDC046909]|uniref:SDR family oxidoreductase n=1 Tax=Streptomyces sp. NPDC046909 TaxID=3155617 RepID=UPI0033C036CA